MLFTTVTITYLQEKKILQEKEAYLSHWQLSKQL